MTLAVRIISLLMLASVLGCASQINTNLSTDRGENARRTTQKTGAANYHLSSWNLNVWSHHSYVRV